MIFAFPYHDPEGQYNKVFKNNLGLLKEIFSKIVVSVSPKTAKLNGSFVEYLKTNGLLVANNSEKSVVGDHFRGALKIALDGSSEDIFYGFIDRVLFILESPKKQFFINDLKKCSKFDMVIFERSNKAWESHPKNYRQMEDIVSRVGKLVIGKYVELNPCAMVFNSKTAQILLDNSICELWEVLGEWVLISLREKLNNKFCYVDWLEWEDPFWENTDPIKLKLLKEKNSEETLKRIKSNLPFLNLFTQERFKSFFPTR